MPRIWITGPAGNSAEYASAARSAGWEPVELALVHIEAVDVDLVPLATRKFDAYLAVGQASLALAMRRKMSDSGVPLALSSQQLFALVVGLHKEGKWTDSAPVMAEYVATQGAGADPMRIKLAQICVVELGRPQRALDLLAEVDQSRLGEGQRTLYRKVAVAAKHKIATGELELDDAAW